jgi:hypothetical protein
MPASTTVMNDALVFIVVTSSLTTASEASSRFTIQSNLVNAGALFHATILDYAGSQGIPVVQIDNRTATTFDVVISNATSAAATTPLNGTVSFVVSLLSGPKS